MDNNDKLLVGKLGTSAMERAEGRDIPVVEGQPSRGRKVLPADHVLSKTVGFPNSFVTQLRNLIQVSCESLDGRLLAYSGRYYLNETE